MGNPPFVGAKFQSEHQRAQVRRIAGLGGSGGTLDYVAAWFLKAGAFVNNSTSPLAGEVGALAPGERPSASALEKIGTGDDNPSPRSASLSRPLPQGERGSNHRIRIAFVSTNSITQGEQVAQLWPILFHRLRMEIAFAHRTFAWPGKAAVH